MSSRQRRNRHINAEMRINLIPMMDMLATILIYLLINFSDELDVQVDASIQLPVAGKIKADEGTGWRLEVTADRVLINGEAIPGLSPLSAKDHPAWQMFEQMVRERFVDKDKNKRILILADKSLPYPAIETLVFYASKAGFTDFQFLTDRMKEKKS